MTDPQTPDYVLALPAATHRIRDGVAVCDGDGGSRCHWYPGDDCHDEEFPCGHDYVEHLECWIIQWINASDLEDSARYVAYARRDAETLEWDDGVISWYWETDHVTWDYAEEGAS